MEHEYPPPLTRILITTFVLIASFMTQLDGTIANVALPYMQASTSASREQITWVLTSYIIFAAMFTPLSGWLATRFGQRNVMAVSVTGFTIASLLCGIAANFGQLVGFRMLQGIAGAALLPISQAILLNINPPERHGSAMAVWGMGAVIGPIIGPILGGYLTEYFNWRWVFLINLPFGVMAALGLLATMRNDSAETPQSSTSSASGCLHWLWECSSWCWTAGNLSAGSIRPKSGSRPAFRRLHSTCSSCTASPRRIPS